MGFITNSVKKRELKHQKALLKYDAELTKTFNYLIKNPDKSAKAAQEKSELKVTYGGPKTFMGKLTNIFGIRSADLSDKVSDDEIKGLIEKNESYLKYKKMLEEDGYQLEVDKINNKGTEKNFIKGLTFGFGSASFGLGYVTPIILPSPLAPLAAFTILGCAATGFISGCCYCTSHFDNSNIYMKITKAEQTKENTAEQQGAQLLDDLQQQALQEAVTVPAQPAQNIIK